MLIQSLPGQKEETDGDEVKYFSWTKIENRITKATFAVAFEDAVATMKEKLIVLKEHIFVKRIQNEAYNSQKDGLTVDDLLVPLILPKIIAMINKTKFKACTLAI